MIITLDAAELTAVLGVVGAIAGAVAGVIRALYKGRETEREGRLADRVTFTTEMLAVGKTLREEDAREITELRAKLEAAVIPPTPPRALAPTRRKSR